MSQLCITEANPIEDGFITPRCSRGIGVQPRDVARGKPLREVILLKYLESELLTVQNGISKMNTVIRQWTTTPMTTWQKEEYERLSFEVDKRNFLENVKLAMDPKLRDLRSLQAVRAVEDLKHMIAVEKALSETIHLVRTSSSGDILAPLQKNLHSARETAVWQLERQKSMKAEFQEECKVAESQISTLNQRLSTTVAGLEEEIDKIKKKIRAEEQQTSKEIRAVREEAGITDDGKAHHTMKCNRMSAAMYCARARCLMLVKLKACVAYVSENCHKKQMFNWESGVSDWVGNCELGKHGKDVTLGDPTWE